MSRSAPAAADGAGESARSAIRALREFRQRRWEVVCEPGGYQADGQHLILDTAYQGFVHGEHDCQDKRRIYEKSRRLCLAGGRFNRLGPGSVGMKTPNIG